MAAPTGAGKQVTLVCTDVEGSTELWEWDKEAMDEAQAQHDRIMRSQLSHFCGYEVGSRSCCLRACWGSWLSHGLALAARCAPCPVLACKPNVQWLLVVCSTLCVRAWGWVKLWS